MVSFKKVIMSNTATVHPCARLGGSLSVPGDKSISHRIALLASISKGTSTVRNFLQSSDCISLVRGMEALGARSYFSRDGALHIQGTSGRIMQPAGPLDMGNSGTAMRLLSGFVAGFNVPVVLTGDESLRSRPMTRIQEPLARMGAQIELIGDAGRAPIRVQGGELKGITYDLPVASAQVKSCVLLAALHAAGTTVITEPQPTRDHTERLFQTLGIPVTMDGLKISLEGFGARGPGLASRDWAIPGDFSSAAFWLVAAAANRKASLTIKDVGLNPRRTALLNVLKRMGARIKISAARSKSEVEEPVGQIRVSGARLKGTVIGGEEIPNLIDELPILAVAGALAEGETVIKDAYELRVKESDRIYSMCVNLRALGVDVEEMKDGMVVHGPCRISAGATVNSFGDHRIAMSMAILALFAAKPLTINNIACIETSYPGFWDDLKRLGAHVE